MSTILPEGDNYRRAVQWISEILKERPDAKLMALVDEAALKFDLSPVESEHLAGFYRAAAANARSHGRRSRD